MSSDKKILSILLITIMIFSGCATEYIDRPIPDFSFQPEEEYVLDLSKLPDDVEAPNFFFLKQDARGNLMVFDPDEEPDVEPVAVGIPREDLFKIDAMLYAKDMYMDISHEQAALINIERQKVTALKEILMLERQSRQLERDLRIEVEHAYRRQRRDHMIDNVMNRTTMVFMAIGGILIAAL